MPVRSDNPLRKCTLNLYEADVIWLQKTYGLGWTERVRQHIHHTVTERRVASPVLKPSRQTLGDLTDE